MEFLLKVLKRTETTDYKLKSEDLLILKQEILHKIPWQVCPMERSLLFRNDVILLTSFHFSPQTNSLTPFFVIIKHQQSFFLFSAARTSVLSHAVRQRVLDPGLKPHSTCMCASMWTEMGWLPCWLPRGQQVLHQRWIWGIHCTQAMKHTSERSNMASKPRSDITKSPTRRYQWSHKKD